MSWPRWWNAPPGPEPPEVGFDGLVCPVEDRLPSCEAGPLGRLVFALRELRGVATDVPVRRSHGT